jgi:hypothetical protein
MAVYLQTMLFGRKYAMFLMIKRGGAIINISSVAVRRGYGLVAYATYTSVLLDAGTAWAVVSLAKEETRWVPDIELPVAGSITATTSLISQAIGTTFSE